MTSAGLLIGACLGSAAAFTLIVAIWLFVHRYLTREKRAAKQAQILPGRRWLQAGLNPQAARVAEDEAIEDEIRRNGGTTLPEYDTSKDVLDVEANGDLPRYEPQKKKEEKDQDKTPQQYA